jgi:hypothetical protein
MIKSTHLVAIVIGCGFLCSGIAGVFQYFNCNRRLRDISHAELKNEGVFPSMIPPTASHIYVHGCRYRGSGTARFSIDNASFQAWATIRLNQESVTDIPPGGQDFTYLYDDNNPPALSKKIPQGWFLRENISEDAGIEIVFDAVANTGYVSWW